MSFSSKHFLAGCVALSLLVSCGDSEDPSPVAPGASNSAPVGQNGMTVVSPNGGESFKVGDSIRVVFKLDTVQAKSANLSPTGGVRVRVNCGADEWFDLTSQQVNYASPQGETTTKVGIPDSTYSSSTKKIIAFPVSSSCKLKVMDYSEGAINDVSDAVFTIKAK